MSFQAPPQTNVGPPGTQGNMIPGYLPPTALPPPPIPPSFAGYQVPPPGQIQGGPQPGFSNSGQGHRPHFVKKQNDYYDKRNYQQNYRPPSDKPTVTVFVGNITEHASDALIRQLLMKCGIVINWKRVQGADGKLQAFGFCEYVDPETGLRAIRLLHDLSFGDKNLVVKVDQKTKEMLEEYKKKKALINSSSENKDDEEELDEATKSHDEEVKKAITGLLSENADVLSGKFKASGSVSKWKQTHSGNEENLEGMGMDKDKRHLISKEIRSFRDTYKDSQKQQRDKDKEDDGERNRNRERQRERSPEKERERSRSQEKPRDRSDDRSRSQSKERERDRDRDSKDRDRENRDRDRENRDRRDRDRDRRDREGDRRDREGDRRDREGDRRDRDVRENKGSSRSNRDREVDEDDSYERRKRERRQKERSQAFVERLKAWETRERKKQREYDRELEKEREIESEQSREKKHLLEFLEDYDDEQDDPKYYRGSSFDRRLQARIQEMESDDKDRQREMEEIEEIRKRLGDRAVEPEEEESMEEEPEEPPEPEPEPRPTLQATFKPAVPVVESAPKVASPVPQYHSPQSFPAGAQNHKPKVTEPQTEVDGEATQQKKTFVFEMKSKGPVASGNSNRKKLEAVFNSEEDTFNAQAPKRKLIPLDYSEEEKKAVATAKSAEQKKKSIKSLIERIPTAKNELFAYQLDWECVDQNLIDRRIRPWVNKKIVEYIGEEEPSLVDFMCTKLLARSAPDNILHDVSMVLDDEAEVFVVKMWRLLIYETEAKKIGLVK